MLKPFIIFWLCLPVGDVPTPAITTPAVRAIQYRPGHGFLYRRLQQRNNAQKYPPIQVQVEPAEEFNQTWKYHDIGGGRWLVEEVQPFTNERLMAAPYATEPPPTEPGRPPGPDPYAAPPVPEVAPVAPQWPAMPAAGLTFPAACIEVVDGDTLTVRVTFALRLRLDQCWAPESRTTDLAEKQRGLLAKANMVDMALGKPVMVHIPGKTGIKTLGELTTLGRVVARAWVTEPAAPPASLSERQVTAGFAATQKGLPLGQ